ncbi:MAG: DUF92 domain-containing protein [Clostridiales bacterium]|jgi:uncharacterized membrane protein/dolichol kinase|nr:DUF92 domain-containing protein [Clostridiales bacterium]
MPDGTYNFKFTGNGLILNLIGLAASYAFVISILCLSLLLKARGKLKDEWNRKFVHIAVAHWSLIYYFLLDNFWFALFVPLTFIALNALSYKKGLIKSIERAEGAKYPGTVYYAASTALLAVLGFAAGYRLYAMAAMLAFGWGDALAGIIGVRFGKRKFPAPLSDKSLAGGLAAFAASVAAVLAIALPTLFFAPEQLAGGAAVDIRFALGLALVAGTAGAAAELISRYGLDNILMPAALFLACLAFGATDLRGFCIAAAVSVLVAGAAFGLKALTADAFLAAVVTGVLLYLTGGAGLFAALTAFFVIANVAGFVGAKRRGSPQCSGHFSLSQPITDCPSKENSPTKKEKSVGEQIDNNPDNTSQFPILNSQLKDGEQFPQKRGRTAIQVFCNSAPALLFAALFYFTGKAACLVGAYGALAFSLADTLASEIGILSKKLPLDVATFKPVQRGLSGGVSPLGLIASAAGAAAIAACPLFDAALNPPALAAPYALNPLAAVMVFCGGFLGALFDSLLGSRFQAKYLLPDGAGLTENAGGGPYHLARGFRFVDNNAVNLLSCAFAGLVCFSAGLFL